MPGLSIPGRLAKLEVSQDGGATFQNFGGIVDVGMNINIDELEDTSHDTTTSRTYQPNLADLTMDVSARWQDGDPGQEIVMGAVFSSTALQFRFYMQILSGRKVFTGSMFATSANPKGPLDDLASLDLTMRLSGVTMETQT